MITHGDEEVEEQLAAVLHLDLHCTAALECRAAADDKSKIVSTQLGVIVRSMSVCPTSRRKDRGNLDA